ncbi:VanZ family protein [Maribacter cobaltidurans]|uniref:VanZ family protein n=1 Tax=Maribacter cobaltidurans TaxID=1178778 RepID=UPI0013155D05
MFVTFSSLFSFKGVQMGSFAFNVPHVDKLVHFIFYFIMVILGFLALRNDFKHRFSLKRTLLWIVLFSIIYGIIIEVLQYTITVDRQGDILDALANSLGAFMGLLLVKSTKYRDGSLK